MPVFYGWHKLVQYSGVPVPGATVYCDYADSALCGGEDDTGVLYRVLVGACLVLGSYWLIAGSNVLLGVTSCDDYDWCQNSMVVPLRFKSQNWNLVVIRRIDYRAGWLCCRSDGIIVNWARV